MISLRGRLGRDLFITLCLLMVAVLAGSGYMLSHLVRGYILERLQHDADGIIGAMDFSPERGLTLDPARIAPVFDTPYSGHYFTVRTPITTRPSRSLWQERLDDVVLQPGQSRVHWQEGPEDKELMVYSIAGIKQGQPFVLSVAEDYSAVRNSILRLQLVLALVAVALLLLGIFIQRAVLRAGLRPLDRVRDELKRLESGEIAALGTDVPQELQPLVAEINRLVGHMRERMQRSRTALGNLAHALKGPLTGLLRLARDPAIQSQPERASELEQLASAIDHRVERELRRARIAGNVMPGRRADVRAVVDDLVMTLNKIHRDRPIAFSTELPDPLPFPADHDDLTELLGNLLDNACKWAAGRVRVAARVDEGLQLVVEDDGQGCPTDQLERLTHRGARIDESREGHGLGLAIVYDIVTQYGGRIHFDCDGELGGLRVRVSLPAR